MKLKSNLGKFVDNWNIKFTYHSNVKIESCFLVFLQYLKEMSKFDTSFVHAIWYRWGSKKWMKQCRNQDVKWVLTGIGGKIIMTRKENGLEPGVRYLMGILSSRWKEPWEGPLVWDYGTYYGRGSGTCGHYQQQNISGVLSPWWKTPMVRVVLVLLLIGCKTGSILLSQSLSVAIAIT